MLINIYAAWIGFFAGCLAGAILGMYFHDKDWMGGYASWRRRMMRLGHIAFFGVGMLNLGFALTTRTLGIETGLAAISALFVVGLVTMPLVCFLSAWKTAFRHLFFIPALSVTVGIGLFAWRIMS